MEVWKIIFFSKWVICRFHVNFPGCMNPWLFSKNSIFAGWNILLIVLEGSVHNLVGTSTTQGAVCSTCAPTTMNWTENFSLAHSVASKLAGLEICFRGRRCVKGF